MFRAMLRSTCVRTLRGSVCLPVFLSLSVCFFLLYPPPPSLSKTTHCLDNLDKTAFTSCKEMMMNWTRLSYTMITHYWRRQQLKPGYIYISLYRNGCRSKTTFEQKFLKTMPSSLIPSSPVRKSLQSVVFFIYLFMFLSSLGFISGNFCNRKHVIFFQDKNKKQENEMYYRRINVRELHNI